MRKYLVVVLVVVLLGCWYNDDNGDYVAPPDPCIGENIRSFTEDWSAIFCYVLETTAGHDYIGDLCELHQPDIYWDGVHYENAVAFHHEVLSPTDGKFYEGILYAEAVDAHDADVLCLFRKHPSGSWFISVEGWINICDDVLTLHVEGHEVYYDFEAVWVGTVYYKPKNV